NTKAPCTSPVAAPTAAAPEPRYGTPTMLVPAMALICVTAIAGDVAGPDVPKLTLLGLALASATSSATVLYGSAALTTSTSGGPSTTMPIREKSLIGS